MAELHPTIKKVFQDMWNGHNVDVANELFEEDVSIYYGDDVVNGISVFKTLLEEWFLGIPNICHVVDDSFSKDNKVVTRWHGYGTHTGPFCNIPASGKEFHYSGITIFELNESNKITRAWASTDFNSQLQTLHE